MTRSAAALFIVLALSIQAQDAAPAPPRFAFGGFGDAVFAYSSRNGTTSFDIGELDFFLTARLNDRWTALGEGFLQHVRRSNDVDLQSTKRVEVDVERLYIAYNPSDRLRVEVGQIHTGIIQWNEREHRSRFLQTPIGIPSIANREEQGGAWPLHFVGVWGSGRLPGTLGAQYGAGIGEARGAARDEIQPLLDPDASLAALVSFSVAPDAMAGFEAGAAAYHGHIPARDGRLVERDATLFASFVRGGIELRSEWARMQHRRSGARFTTSGWYALASFRPRGRWQVIRPYLLIDHLDVAPGEAYLSEVRDQDSYAAGIRWDVMRRLAIKGELISHLKGDSARDHGVRAQVAFSF